MAITELGTDILGAPRRLRDEITNGLQVPIGEVVRTLQHLALAQVGPDSETLDPQLLVRARSLAHALVQVVDELVAFGADHSSFDGREPQETILIRSAIENAAAASVETLGERAVSVRGKSRIAITTNPDRFHNLLVRVFEAVEGEGDLRIVVDRSRGELLLQFDRCEIASPELDAIRGLARSLGGTADRAPSSSGAKLILWIPQQRASDSTEA